MPNTEATGDVLITGVLHPYETVTVDTSALTDADGMTNAVLSYQWYVNSAAVDGETGESYDIKHSNGGDTLLVRVSFTDDEGNAESVDSALATIGYHRVGDVVQPGSKFDPDIEESYWITCVNDHSRRIVRVASANPDTIPVWNTVNQVDQYQSDKYIVFFWGAQTRDFRFGGYFLPYPKDRDSITWQNDPVNQFWYLQPTGENWWGQVALFAHELDVMMGTKSAQDASETDKQAIYEWGIAMCGIVWIYLDRLSKIDPEQLEADGVTLSWQHYIDTVVRPRLDELCAQCDSATYARRALRHADISALRNYYRGGQIVGLDRTTTPWPPGNLLYQVPLRPSMTQEQFHSTIRDFFDETEEWYRQALLHYDDISGRRAGGGHPERRPIGGTIDPLRI